MTDQSIASEQTNGKAGSDPAENIRGLLNDAREHLGLLLEDAGTLADGLVPDGADMAKRVAALMTITTMIRKDVECLDEAKVSATDCDTTRRAARVPEALGLLKTSRRFLAEMRHELGHPADEVELDALARLAARVELHLNCATDGAS